MNGVERIALERKRQLEHEGWTAEHDDNFDCMQLSRAAICYVLPEEIRSIYIGSLFQKQSLLNELWPWDNYWWKPEPDSRIKRIGKGWRFNCG